MGPEVQSDARLLGTLSRFNWSACNDLYSTLDEWAADVAELDTPPAEETPSDAQ